MNQIVEKSLSTVSNVVDSLKNSPIILALVLLQMLTLGAILYSSTHRQAAISQQIQNLTDIIKACVAKQ